jgi:hypothetical protein
MVVQAGGHHPGSQPRRKFPTHSPRRAFCDVRHRFVLSTNLRPSRPPLPAALVRRAAGLFHCARRQRSGARLCLFRGRAGAEIGGGSTGRLRIGALVFVCVAWRAAPLVGSGVCRAARKLPPTKKPITPANNVRNSQRRIVSRWRVDPSATNQMRMPPAKAPQRPSRGLSASSLSAVTASPLLPP